jgi:hypothetical protein
MNRIGLIALCIIIFFIYKYELYKEKQSEKISEEAFGSEISKTMKDNSHKAIREFCIRTYNLQRYNSQNWDEFMDLINEFLSIYELNLIDPSVSTKTYALLVDRRELILNIFMSFQILIPTEYNLKAAVRDLELILNDYLQYVYDINAEYVNQNGFNTNTIILNQNDLAVNRFTENVGSFSQY